MRLYLIRHAITPPTVPDSHLWPLSQEGEAQSALLAQALFWDEVSALYSSPESKGLSMVRPASATHGLQIEEDERLRETRRPAKWIDDYDGAVRRYLEHPADPPEEWEGAPDVRARMVECIGEISARHPQKAVALCGHGLALALYLSSLPSFGGSVIDRRRSIGLAPVVEGGEKTTPFVDPSEGQ
ncbi:MAG TPA: histidine phosphatase family protein [Rubrobacter sp.]|nr:histidine phosphatase family protein [Rubrobacter sp.]